MRTPIIVLLTVLSALGGLYLSGCVSADPISRQHAHEANDTVDKYLDPTLPESLRKALQAQANEWDRYEKSK